MHSVWTLLFSAVCNTIHLDEIALPEICLADFLIERMLNFMWKFSSLEFPHTRSNIQFKEQFVLLHFGILERFEHLKFKVNSDVDYNLLKIGVCLPVVVTTTN